MSDQPPVDTATATEQAKLLVKSGAISAIKAENKNSGFKRSRTLEGKLKVRPPPKLGPPRSPQNSLRCPRSSGPPPDVPRTPPNLVRNSLGSPQNPPGTLPKLGRLKYPPGTLKKSPGIPQILPGIPKTHLGPPPNPRGGHEDILGPPQTPGGVTEIF